MKTNVLRTSILTLLLSAAAWAGTGPCSSCSTQPPDFFAAVAAMLANLCHLFG
jgi:hypothetical protein